MRASHTRSKQRCKTTRQSESASRSHWPNVALSISGRECSTNFHASFFFPLLLTQHHHPHNQEKDDADITLCPQHRPQGAAIPNIVSPISLVFASRNTPTDRRFRRLERMSNECNINFGMDRPLTSYFSYGHILVTRQTLRFTATGWLSPTHYPSHNGISR